MRNAHLIAHALQQNGFKRLVDGRVLHQQNALGFDRHIQNRLLGRRRLHQGLSQAIDDARQLIDIDRFDQEPLDAQLIQLLQTNLLTQGTHHDDRHLRLREQLSQLRSQCKAINIGHVHIDQSTPSQSQLRRMQRLSRPIYCRSVQAQGLQLMAQHLATTGIVIHQQECLPCPRCTECLRARGSIHQGVQLHVKTEIAAMTQLALHADVTAHHAHQAAADGQTQSCASKTTHSAGISLGEDIKNQGLFVHSDTDTGVLDRELQPNAISAGWRSHQFHTQQNFTVCREFDGIAQQIDHHLLQAQGIADDLIWHIASHIANQLQFFFTRTQRQCAYGLPYQALQRKGMRIQTELARLDFGKVQDVIDHGQQ